MTISGNIPPTFPFRVAQAYGVNPAAQVQRVSPQATSGVQRTQAAEGVAPSAPAQRLSPAGRALVAGVVPGGVDFSGDAPRPTQGALAMYRHPADKNAAATAVNVGRALDVRG